MDRVVAALRYVGDAYAVVLTCTRRPWWPHSAATHWERTFGAEAALAAGLIEARCPPGEAVRAAVERAGAARQLC